MLNELTILSESLDKKMEVLAQIQKYNLEQERTFTDGQADLTQFDAAIERKGELIQELTRLDEGFEALYAKVAAELTANKDMYAPQIRELQKKISAITELSVTIQTQEKRNKTLVEQFFAQRKEGIRQSRKSSKVAYDYYKRMSGTSYAPPQFLDSKQ